MLGPMPNGNYLKVDATNAFVPLVNGLPHLAPDPEEAENLLTWAIEHGFRVPQKLARAAAIMILAKPSSIHTGVTGFFQQLRPHQIEGVYTNNHGLWLQTDGARNPVDVLGFVPLSNEWSDVLAAKGACTKTCVGILQMRPDAEEATIRFVAARIQNEVNRRRSTAFACAVLPSERDNRMLLEGLRAEFSNTRQIGSTRRPVDVLGTMQRAIVVKLELAPKH